MLELITDRTQNDVVRLTNILLKRSEDRTPEEQQELDSYASKGAYNYTDLNRVNAAVEYLARLLESLGYVNDYEKIVVHPTSGQLPDGFVKLEYIESNGTQYIDTGIKPDNSTKCVFEAEVLSTNTGTDHHLSSAIAGGNYFVIRLKQDKSGYAARWGTAALKDVPHTGAIFAKHTFSLSKDGAQIDDASVATFPSVTFSVSASLPIFGYVSGTSAVSQFSSMRLYSYRVYSNESLVRNFVPCKNASGTVGLYDLVGSKFYKSGNAKVFTAGPEASSTEELPMYEWVADEIPSSESLQAYISNLQSLKRALSLPASTSTLPSDLNTLTISQANNIEKFLLEVEQWLENIKASWFYSGELFSGEV